MEGDALLRYDLRLHTPTWTASCLGLSNNGSGIPVISMQKNIIILMECFLQTPQIQLHEIANHIANATGSAFSPQTLYRTVYRLGITRNKVSRSHF